MKKLMIAILTAALSMGAVADEQNIVYINIPGEKSVCVKDATITMLDHGLVKVTTLWGDTYTTHFANVVVICRKTCGK